MEYKFIKKWLCDQDDFEQVMFICADKTSRMYLRKIMMAMFSKLWKIQQLVKEGKLTITGISEEGSKVEELTDKLFNYIGSNICLQNWQRFDQYFKLLADLAVESQEASKYFIIEKKAIFTIMDFMLGNDSPFATEKRVSMGQGSVQPKFNSSIELVSRLALHCETDSNKPYNATRPLPILGKLSVEELVMLRSSFFISQALDDGEFYNDDVGLALAHLSNNNKCYEDICDKAVIEIYKNTEGSCHFQFKVISYVIQANIDKAVQILQIVFGIPII